MLFHTASQMGKRGTSHNLWGLEMRTTLVRLKKLHSQEMRIKLMLITFLNADTNIMCAGGDNNEQ
jgi:hypothetical protein